jgi:hypothetical protein
VSFDVNYFLISVMTEGMDMKDVQAIIDKIKGDLQEEKSEEEILESLLQLSEKDPGTIEKVADSLAGLPHERVAKVLQRMLQGFEGKKVRKVIKRSLYRLKSKGVAIEKSPSDKEKPVLHPFQAESPKGYGTPVDSLGQRLFILVIPHVGRGWAVLQGVVSDTKGIVDFSGEEMTRKGFRSFFQGIQEKIPFPLVEVEVSYVAFLLEQAHRLNLQNGSPSSRDFLRSKNELEPIKKEYERPLIYSHLRIEELEENDRMLRGSENLLKSDLFVGWRIPEGEIRPYADAALEAEESKIVLSQAQKEARFQEIYRRALSDLFPEHKRLLYKKRLEEMAYVLLQLKREEEARMSLAAAIDLEKPSNPFQPNPFLFQLVVRSVITLLAEAQEKKKEELSLLVKP